MGRRNFLVEGVSCSGKSTVCLELQRRGYHAVNGDTELAYQGDPETGLPTRGRSHEHHLWRIDELKGLLDQHVEPVTFFCGGSRNWPAFIDLFDGVFVLDIDDVTLRRRLHERADDEWGARPDERALVVRLHQTKEDTPDGVLIDATHSLGVVVDEILRLAGCPAPESERGG